jgi:Flp pilus assembly pilin Flp
VANHLLLLGYLKAKAVLAGLHADAVGQTMVEYMLVIGLVSIALVLVFMNAGMNSAVGTFVGRITDCLSGSCS